MNKIVVIINGRGGVGKDTICDIVSRYYPTTNVSSITPILDIAKLGGWSGEKDPKSRRLLSDLKNIFTEYNDLSTRYVLQKYNEFLQDNKVIMFVHIREVSEIEKFKSNIKTKCITLLIERESIPNSLGNQSDDLVGNFKYDYYYYNNQPLEELESRFMSFFNNILEHHSLLG